MDKANTPDEIVDVIDENENVIGQASKAEVNSNPKLLHREISILIFDDQNRILVQQRSKNKKNSPLVWTLSVAGHVPSGKSYEEAAHMELLEELGFDTKLIFYEKVIFRVHTETQSVANYIGKFPETALVKIDTNEIEAYKFFGEHEVEDLNKTDKIEESSLEDFRKFFRGEYNEFTKELED